MIRHLPILALSVILGCNSSQKQAATSSVAATSVTKAMIGQWGEDGEVSLIITQTGDRIVLAAPHNEVWRMDTRDAKIVGDSIHFIQENYLHDGTEHPFNGVVCNSIVKLLEDDMLEFGMTTKSSPEYDATTLTRIE